MGRRRAVPTLAGARNSTETVSLARHDGASLVGNDMDLVTNRLADAAAPYSTEAAEVVSRVRSEAARALLSACPHFRQTPLRAFAPLAAELRLGAVYVKDETQRLGLTSFKALGGAYAVMRKAQAGGAAPGRAAAGAPVFVAATDGNHGISVAAGAAVAGARSVIYLPQHVEEAYEGAMRALGADIVRTHGSYDEAVAAAAAAAEARGWVLVADTTEEACDPVTRDVMDGYGVLVLECLEQLQAAGVEVAQGGVTHLFVQAGVGGLAAALAGGFWQELGPRRPRIVIVEPRSADCLYQSAAASRLASAAGDLATSMGMLSCGRPSRMAWTVLQTAADHVLVIDDSVAAAGARAFAAGLDTPAHTSPSGGAGLGGLIQAASSSGLRREIGLDETSVVLTVCTEGRPDLAAAQQLRERLARRAGP